MLSSLDQVTIAVRDLESATRTLIQLLGRAPSWRGEHQGMGTANVLFRLANTTLELRAPAESGEGAHGAQLRRWLDEHGEGLLALAFGTEDVEAFRARAAEAGLAPGAPEKGMDRDVDSGAFREWLRVPLPAERARGVRLSAVEHRAPVDIVPPAAPLGDEAATVFALDHVVVQSAEADATRDVYGKGLGLRLALDKTFEQWGARLLFFRVGGVTVEVAAQLGDEAKPEALDLLWGLSHRVHDADAAQARLAGAGFDVSDVRSGRRPGTRVFTVRNPTLGVATLMLEPPAAV